MIFKTINGSIEESIEVSVQEFNNIVKGETIGKHGQALKILLGKYLRVDEVKDEIPSIPILEFHNQDLVIGKVSLLDMNNLPKETNFHFEPAFRKNPDGSIELLEISLVLDKKWFPFEDFPVTDERARHHNCKCSIDKKVKKKGKKKHGV